MKTCTARQYSDQMICDRCALQWDMNDDDPPACLPEKPVAPTPVEVAHRAAMQRVKWLFP